MPVGDVGTVVPIVQIKIVQKRAAHQADFIGMAMPVQVEPVGDAGHPQAMLVGGDGAVLDELLHLQRVGIIGNAAPGSRTYLLPAPASVGKPSASTPFSVGYPHYTAPPYHQQWGGGIHRITIFQSEYLSKLYTILSILKLTTFTGSK